MQPIRCLPLVTAHDFNDQWRMQPINCLSTIVSKVTDKDTHTGCTQWENCTKTAAAFPLFSILWILYYKMLQTLTQY